MNFGILPFIAGLVSTILELGGGLACHALEEFTEERRVGEIEFIADEGNGFARVLEFNLDARGQGFVNPLLGALAAHLLDDGAQVARRDAQA